MTAGSQIGEPQAGFEAKSVLSGWSSADIGTTGISGAVESSSDAIVVRAAGKNAGSTSDSFHFVSREMSGDVDLRVRIGALASLHPWARAGLMIRESLTSDARHAAVLISRSKGLAFQARVSEGGPVTQTADRVAALPGWLRLLRRGGAVEAYSSADGRSWTLVGRAAIDLSASVHVGLAVASNHVRHLASATFTDLTVDAGSDAPPPLPAPWTAGDVGAPALPGAATLIQGAFHVVAAGSGIRGTSDQLHFVYQPITGDAEIVARVASLDGATESSSAGVMVRAALTGPAAHVSVLTTAAGGWAFLRRLSDDETSVETAGGSGALPRWVRLVREGHLFSAYESTDGSDWTLIGTDTISMPSTVFVGLAATSQEPAAPATAVFTNVTVGPPSDDNQPPTVSLSSPSPASTFVAPATLTLSAAATDVDGAVTRVDFYQGSQLLGSDTVSPFELTLSNVAPGTHTLTAVAFDNAGASSTSPPVTITITATVSSDTATLLFVPSADHVTNVSSYTVEIRREGEGLGAVPAAASNLGKPPVVNGEIAMPISALLATLPPGSYYAVVIASGPGGSTSSAPSPVFSN